MRGLVYLFTAVICLLPAGSFAARDTILVIESYHAQYPWDKSYKEGLENVLGTGYNLKYFQMDTKRIPKSEYQRKDDEAWDTYTSLEPRLVILGDDNALKFLGPRFAKTKTPIVYLGINNNPRDYHMDNKENITGILERPLLKRSISVLDQILQPKPKKILVLFDNGTTSQVSLIEYFGNKTVIDISGISVKLELIGDRKKWEQVVIDAQKNGFDAMVVGLYHTVFDAQKKHVPADELLKWTSAHSPVPPFCFWDFSVGSDKTIGGLVLFGKTQGEKAGKIALDILSGKKPSDIMPQIGEKGRYFFSRSQLKKWGIQLPDRIVKKASFMD
jgi:hypothetical protein